MKIGVMNNTKWDELANSMAFLRTRAPRWRTRDRVTGHISDWDGDWFHHFRVGGFDTIEWVELKLTDEAHRAAVKAALLNIHVPGEETPQGFRVVGWLESGTRLDYIK